jgi:flagellar biosynthesis/type III secretory pathway protein FliH
VDWLPCLPENLEQQFKQQLEQLEAQTQMRYVTSIERIAREEGREEGREKGREEGREKGREKGREEGATYVLLRLLEHRFGELPEAVTAHVQRLSLAQTEALVNHALGAESLAQFVTHLPE